MAINGVDITAQCLGGVLGVAGAGGGGGRQWTEAHSLRLAMLIGGFIIAVVALGLVIMAARRRMLASENELTGARSLMDQLRVMRQRGEMSEEEYEATRRALATKVAAQVKGQGKGQGTTAPPSYATKMSRAALEAARSGLESGAKVARPGFDLTGAPLPGTGGHAEAPESIDGPEGPPARRKKAPSEAPPPASEPPAPPGYTDG